MKNKLDSARECFKKLNPHLSKTKEDLEYWFTPGNSKTIEAYIKGWEARDEEIIKLTERIHELTNEINDLKEDELEYHDYNDWE